MADERQSVGIIDVADPNPKRHAPRYGILWLTHV
jgi:hypothetical protein